MLALVSYSTSGKPRSQLINTPLVVFCGTGVFIAMLLVTFSAGKEGAAASFGVFAFALSFGPTSIIDSIRTSMWDSNYFGTAYALKIMMNNS